MKSPFVNLSSLSWRIFSSLPVESSGLFCHSPLDSPLPIHDNIPCCVCYFPLWLSFLVYWCMLISPVSLLWFHLKSPINRIFHFWIGCYEALFPLLNHLRLHWDTKSFSLLSFLIIMMQKRMQGFFFLSDWTMVSLMSIPVLTRQPLFFYLIRWLKFHTPPLLHPLKPFLPHSGYLTVEFCHASPPRFCTGQDLWFPSWRMCQVPPRHFPNGWLFGIC